MARYLQKWSLFFLLVIARHHRISIITSRTESETVSIIGSHPVAVAVCLQKRFSKPQLWTRKFTGIEILIIDRFVKTDKF